MEPRHRLDEEEVPLVGGNVTEGVVRVGNTVRRRQGPWSRHVHELLLHLERVGFKGAPRFLGVDERGREVLTFHEGTTWFDPERPCDDSRLAQVFGLGRAFHDAAAGFRTDGIVPFWEGTLDPAGGSVMLHGDLGPWNLVVGPTGCTIIDWDGAAPGHPEWELAYMLYGFVPLWPGSGLDDTAVARRLLVAAEGYGMSRRQLASALELVPARCRRICEHIRLATDGPFARLLEDGHDTSWELGATHVEDRLSVWLSLAAR